MHPAALGITLELAFSVDAASDLSIETIRPRARAIGPLLYVAWLAPSERALKIGLSEKSLWLRWGPILRNMKQPLHRLSYLRPYEVRDREELLRWSREQRVEVWMCPHPASDLTAFGQLTAGMSITNAEVMLDRRYAPLFGRPLGPREPWVTSAPGPAPHASPLASEARAPSARP